MIKYLKLIIFIIIIFSSFDTLAKDNNIYIYQNNKAIGQFTPQEFKALVEGAEAYSKELEAEKSDATLRIDLIDDPYKLEQVGLWGCRFSIKWLDTDGSILKEIQLKSEIQIPEGENLTSLPKWRIVYRNISEVGFPLSTSVLMLFFIVVVFL